MDITSQPLTFVDIETTGLNPVRDRIIEVAAIRVENGKVVETFEQLINPEILFPPEITLLTGISNEQVEQAPRFFDLKEDIKRLTKDSLFIAHNARFDYGFIRQEFRRYEETFTQKQLCTVKLFKALVPGLSHYNLDTLLSYFDISIQYRHRALSDAIALWEFIQKALLQYSPEVVEAAVNKAMKRQSLPTHITEEDIDALPERPGVYLMYGEDPTPLYIGKSISIRERVLSHFAESLRSPKEIKLAHQVRRIETRETPGELSALLLESSLVKIYQPHFNRQLRKVQKMMIAKEQAHDGEFLTLSLEQVDHIDVEMIPSILSVFRSNKQAKERLLELAKEHSLCPKLLGLENSSHGCFWQELGWCKGACVGKESVASYNLRFKTAFASFSFKQWPFPGPVVISEEGESTSGAIVVDKWCVLGTMEDQEMIPTFSPEEYLFDVDTYKILARYIFSTKHQMHIKLLRETR